MPSAVFIPNLPSLIVFLVVVRAATRTRQKTRDFSLALSPSGYVALSRHAAPGMHPSFALPGEEIAE
jgi:hypothetical protein